MDAVRAAVGRSLLVVLAGLGLGVLVGGVLGRLAMYLLAELNPDVAGVISDDGFEMGRFTLEGTLNLLVVGGALGAFGGVVYLAVRVFLLAGRAVEATASGLGAGVPVGDLIVHTDGVDFTLLEPVWLLIAIFVAIPALFGVLLCLVVEPRWPRPKPEGRPVVALLWAGRVGFLAIGVAFLLDLAGKTSELV